MTELLGRFKFGGIGVSGFYLDVAKKIKVMVAIGDATIGFFIEPSDLSEIVLGLREWEVKLEGREKRKSKGGIR